MAPNLEKQVTVDVEGTDGRRADAVSSRLGTQRKASLRSIVWWEGRRVEDTSSPITHKSFFALNNTQEPDWSQRRRALRVTHTGSGT